MIHLVFYNIKTKYNSFFETDKKKKKIVVGRRFLVFILTFVFLNIKAIYASSDGGGHGTTVPAVVGWQLLNFTIFLGILGIALKKTVKNYFIARKNSFLLALDQAQANKTTAQNNYHEVKNRLDLLIENQDKNSEKAHIEGEAFKKEILREAHTQALTIKSESLKIIEIYKSKAEEEIRFQILLKAMDRAKQMLLKNEPSVDQTKLHEDFLKKMRDVQHERNI